jgi:prophage antirepressor-like protein
MNDMKVFNHTEFGKLSVLVIESKEYFPATECARILGYVKPHDAIKQHCKNDCPGPRPFRHLIPRIWNQ